MIAWRVAEKPKGRYKSFYKREWPKAYVGPDDDRPVAFLFSTESYSPKIKDITELEIRIADYSVKGAVFEWKKLRARAMGVKDAKEIVENWLAKHPEWLPDAPKLVAPPDGRWLMQHWPLQYGPLFPDSKRTYRGGALMGYVRTPESCWEEVRVQNGIIKPWTGDDHTTSSTTINLDNVISWQPVPTAQLTRDTIKLIQDLCSHEGAEGFSAGLSEEADRILKLLGAS